MEERPSILHADLDAFYASVEQLRRPELRGRPVIVGASGRRGVVAAASYEARAFGVFSAMPSLRAQQRCPQAVFIPGDHAHYAEVSGRIMEIFRSTTPFVEPLSLDEAFLDVTGVARLHGDGPAIAHAIRSAVHRTTGLTCSVGVAPNKFLAKLATEQGKPTASPTGPIPGRGVTVVRPGDEVAFLRPLPVRSLWGVGPRTLEKLHRIGVRTVRDLEAQSLPILQQAVGTAAGIHLHRLARGLDDRPVVPDSTPKSIGHEETFFDDLFTHERLHVELVRMGDAVATRLRRDGRTGRTVTVKVRFGDFTTITRSATADRPLDSGPTIVRASADLLERIDVSAGVRLLGVSLSNLIEAPPEQLRLDVDAGTDVGRASRTPDNDSAWSAVTEAVDAVRARFGDDSVVPATLAGDARGPKKLGEQQWGPSAVPKEGGAT